MKVLLIINVRWWNAEAAYAWEKAVGLHMRGHDVALAGLAGSPVIEKARKGGFPVYALGGLNSLNPLTWPGTVRSIRKIIREREIHIVDAHRSEGFPLVAAATIKSGAALVRTRGDMRKPSSDPVNRLIHVYLCDALVASGEVVARQMSEAFNLEETDVEVVYYGVDSVHFSPGYGETLRREWSVGQEEFLVGMVGRVDRVKGLGTFLQAAALVSRRHDNARFLVAVKEDHSDMPTYRDMIEKLDMTGKFIILEHRKDIELVYRALDAVVVASLGSEANCRVTLEAMATAKPVIASSVGVIPEVLKDGVCGHIVPPGEVNDLVEALDGLVAEREVSAEMGRRGRQLVEEKYTRQFMAQRTEDLYRRLM